MSQIIDIFLFALGILIGFLWFCLVLLPILVGAPRSLYWVLRGWARWPPPIQYLLVGLKWFSAFMAALFVLHMLLPDVVRFIIQNNLHNTGQMAAILYLAARSIFSRSARTDLDEDFISFIKPHLTEAGRNRCNMISGTPTESEHSDGSNTQAPLS